MNLRIIKLLLLCMTMVSTSHSMDIKDSTCEEAQNNLSETNHLKKIEEIITMIKDEESIKESINYEEMDTNSTLSIDEFLKNLNNIKIEFIEKEIPELSEFEKKRYETEEYKFENMYNNYKKKIKTDPMPYDYFLWNKTLTYSSKYYENFINIFDYKKMGNDSCDFNKIEIPVSKYLFKSITMNRLISIHETSGKIDEDSYYFTQNNMMEEFKKSISGAIKKDFWKNLDKHQKNTNLFKYLNYFEETPAGCYTSCDGTLAGYMSIFAIRQIRNNLEKLKNKCISQDNLDKHFLENPQKVIYNYITEKLKDYIPENIEEACNTLEKRISEDFKKHLIIKSIRNNIKIMHHEEEIRILEEKIRKCKEEITNLSKININ